MALVGIHIGRSLTFEETNAVIMATGGHIDFAPISTEDGFHVINFSDTPNNEFRQMVRGSVEKASKVVIFTSTRSASGAKGIT